MIDMDLVQESHLYENHAVSDRPSGVIGIGFLLMLAGFPIFFSLASRSPGVPWFAISVSLMVEIVGMGLISMARWARYSGIFISFLLSILLTVRIVAFFVSRVPRSSLDAITFGPTMAVVGLVVAGLVVVLPCFTIMGYLGSREVRTAFWNARHGRR